MGIEQIYWGELTDMLFIYARSQFNNARLEFMPFGYSFITKLSERGDPIEVWLAEHPSDSYLTLFPPNVRVRFIPPSLFRVSFLKKFFVAAYVRLRMGSNGRNSRIIGMGILGNAVSYLLSRQMQTTLWCLSDEFPDTYGKFNLVTAEKKAMRAASLVVVPDEHRVARTMEQIGDTNVHKFHVLPNTPIIKHLTPGDIGIVDELKLPHEHSIVLFNGSMDHYNMLFECLVTFPQWPQSTIFLILGRERYRAKYNHLLNQDRIYWRDITLSNDALDRLIRVCAVTLALYRTDVWDLDLVGKSSGKMMRSLAAGTPVITTKSPSMQFVQDLGLGEIVSHPAALAESIGKIIADLDKYRERIRMSVDQWSYESYWHKFQLNVASEKRA